jgi:hypothetical protein
MRRREGIIEKTVNGRHGMHGTVYVGRYPRLLQPLAVGPTRMAKGPSTKTPHARHVAGAELSRHARAGPRLSTPTVCPVCRNRPHPAPSVMVSCPCKEQNSSSPETHSPASISPWTHADYTLFVPWIPSRQTPICILYTSSNNTRCQAPSLQATLLAPPEQNQKPDRRSSRVHAPVTKYRYMHSVTCRLVR